MRTGNIRSIRLAKKSLSSRDRETLLDVEVTRRKNEKVITYPDIKKKISTPTYPLGDITGKK